MKQLFFSLEDVVSPIDKVEALRTRSAFNGFITFKLDDDKAKLLLENSNLTAYTIPFTIEHGIIKWNAIMTSNGPDEILECRFSKDAGRKFLQRLSSIPTNRAVLVFNTRLNTFSFDVKDIVSEESNRIIENTEQILSPKIAIQKTESIPYPTLNTPKQKLPKSITVFGSDVSFVSYTTPSSNKKHHTRLFELHIRITKHNLHIFTQDSNKQNLPRSFVVWIDNTTSGFGKLVKLQKAYDLVCNFSAQATLRSLKAEVDKNSNTVITISRNKNKYSYNISYSSSFKEKRGNLQNNFGGTQGITRESGKKFIPGGDHEKFFPNTIPKPIDLDKMFW